MAEQRLQEQEPQVHKRRVRYKGKYPRKFSEKYKELNPEKYGEAVSHVISKGNTPAGMHIPIMVEEILQVLNIQPGEQGFDGTLDIWTPKLMNFAEIDKLAAEVGGFDFILADLGVSSMQIDNPERGFSYKAEGPLDLRLNSQAGISAAQRLKELDKESLAGMLVENADEPYAEEIARQIYNTLHKKKKPIDTTTALHEQIVEALSKVKLLPDEDRKMVIKKSSARVFQALRIDVNHEYEVLYEFMEKLPEALRTGGRAAILTFHSGEDRIVKKAFQAFHRAGIYSDIAKEVIKPSREECFRNSRAHSTKLRWAVKA